MNKKVNKLFQQFPNIFRFIPESKCFKKITKSNNAFNVLLGAAIFISVLITVIILFNSVNIYKNILNLLVLKNERTGEIIKRNYWKSISEKYDGYKDAYFQLAIQEYKLGNYNQARNANEKALLLDPSFEEAKKLENLLNK